MIILKPLSIENVKSFYNWINDEEVIKYSLSSFAQMKTKSAIDKWFLSLLSDENDLNLGIFLDSTNELIGYAGLCKISPSNQSAEYFIFIGAREQWGRGLGTAVSKQILHKGFIDYNLNRIMLTVSEPNVGGFKAYQKAGFQLEGRLREASLRDGQFHDKLIMSLLKSEWTEGT